MLPPRQSSSSSSRARRATLQLIAPPARRARPPHIPSRRLPRRPGERREPLALGDLPPEFVAAAEAHGLELVCAVELVLERALTARDLDTIDPSLYRRVVDSAGASPVTTALPPAKARYLQMLLAARALASRSESALDTAIVVDVPLRLFPRVRAVARGAELTPAALAEALQLEIAAVSDGRTMSEWAALAALRLTR